MDYIFSLFDNTLVVVGVGLVALYIIYTKFLSGLRIGSAGGGGAFEAILGKLLGPRYADAKVDRAVAREKKRGNFLGAGRLYEDINKLPQAAEAYVEGQEYYAAAGTLERMGKMDRAAEMYMQAGDYKKAALVFTETGKPAKAAALFLEKGNTLEAARLFGVAQEWGKSADLYAKGGYPLRAAEAYEKKGDFVKAAECHEKHFMENVSYSTAYSATASNTDQKSALLAGRLYEKAGDLNRAFQIYSKGNYFKQAAGALVSLGQPGKAAELFMRAEDPESAAQAYEQAGEIVKAATLRGEVALKSDRVAEAAAFFQQGQDYLRSAELFESIGKLAEAAGAYEAGDSFVAAAGVYVRAGLKDRAAASYERGGEFETAAKFYEETGNGAKAIELYERAGLTFKSGEAAAKAGERDKAIALLQKVVPQDENYRAAAELLASLFIEAKMPGIAVERLQKILGADPVSAANLDLNYWMGAGYEALGNGREALAVYKKILAEDLRFRDVEKRVARLEASGAAAAPVERRAATVAPAPTAAPRPAGPKAPRFSRKEEIGRGPLGAVYRAEDSNDGRSVALRVLPAAALRGEGVQANLVADLKAASQLSHPNLVKVLGFIDLGGERGVVTELVSGRNFAEALKGGHKMAFQQVHSLGRLLAQALAFIHGKGIIHGSIQPSNVMVAAGVVKIADVGLGRVAFPLAPADNYRAPENQLDVAGDLYAMAAVLYHLLTGVNPKSQPQGPALPLPSKLAAGVPEAFDKLLVRCLHPKPELRFGRAEEVLAELKDMVRIG